MAVRQSEETLPDMGGSGYYWEPGGVGRVCEAIETVPGSGSKVLLPHELAESSLSNLFIME